MQGDMPATREGPAPEGSRGPEPTRNCILFKFLCHGAPPPTAVSRSSVARESADPRAGDYSGRAPALHCAAAS